MIAEMEVGEKKSVGGTTTDLRGDSYGGLVTSDCYGRYWELARNGRIYSTFIKTVTVAATHNTPIAAATATPVIGLLNPVNSNIAAVLLRAGFGTTSGTPAGGQAVLNFISGVNQSITATATGSIFSHLLPASGSPQQSAIVPYNNVALTGLSPATGRELLLIGSATAAAAAGNGGPGMSGEDLGGSIIVPPNTLIALMAGTGAGTSWIVNASLTWAEIDWPLP